MSITTASFVLLVIAVLLMVVSNFARKKNTLKTSRKAAFVSFLATFLAVIGIFNPIIGIGRAAALFAILSSLLASQCEERADSLYKTMNIIFYTTATITAGFIWPF